MKASYSPVLGDFVPLFDAIRAVANCVRISDEEADACRGADYPKDTTAFDILLLRGQVKSVVAQTRAARLLLSHLESAGKSSPTWVDASNTTRAPQESQRAADLGLDTLALLSMRSLWLPNGRWVPPAVSFPEAGSIDPSVAHVGFRANELIRFLASVSLDHSLKLPECELPASESHPRQAESSASDSRSVQVPKGAAARADASNAPQVVKLIPADFSFRGDLAFALEQAVRAVHRAEQLDDELAVFEWLRKMAPKRGDERVVPLFGVCQVTGEVLLAVETVDVHDRVFTKKEWHRKYSRAIGRARERLSQPHESMALAP